MRIPIIIILIGTSISVFGDTINTDNYGIRVEIIKSNSPELDISVLESGVLHPIRWEEAVKAKKQGYDKIYFLRFTIQIPIGTNPATYFSGNTTMYISSLNKLISIPLNQGGWSNNKKRILHSSFYTSLDTLKNDFANSTITFNINYQNSIESHQIIVHDLSENDFPNYQIYKIENFQTLYILKLDEIDYWDWIGICDLSEGCYFEEMHFEKLNDKGFITLDQSYNSNYFYSFECANEYYPGLSIRTYQFNFLRDDLSTLALIPGWNLLGLKSDQGKTVTTLIYGNENKIDSIWKWKDGAWAVYLPAKEDGGAAYAESKGFNVLTNIVPGEGFWVNCIEALELP